MDAAFVMILVMFCGLGLNNFHQDFLAFVGHLSQEKVLLFKALLFLTSLSGLALILYDNIA